MTAHRSSSGAAFDPDDAMRPVYLFASGEWRAVATERRPSALPPPPGGQWHFIGCVPLGVRHIQLPGTEPEPVITGIRANGVYVWQVAPAAGLR